VAWDSAPRSSHLQQFGLDNLGIAAFGAIDSFPLLATPTSSPAT
jgi:hypothetical protein